MDAVEGLCLCRSVFCQYLKTTELLRVQGQTAGIRGGEAVEGRGVVEQEVELEEEVGDEARVGAGDDSQSWYRPGGDRWLQNRPAAARATEQWARDDDSRPTRKGRLDSRRRRREEGPTPTLDGSLEGAL